MGRTTSDEYLAYRERRCPECELNEYLDSLGRVRHDRRGQVRSCEFCGGQAHIRLVTVQELKAAPAAKRRRLVKLFEIGAARFATMRETIDPMLVKNPPRGIAV